MALLMLYAGGLVPWGIYVLLPVTVAVAFQWGRPAALIITLGLALLGAGAALLHPAPVVETLYALIVLPFAAWGSTQLSEARQQRDEARTLIRLRIDSAGALQRVTQEIAITVNRDHILNLVLQEALQFSQAEAGLVILWEDGNRRLVAYDGLDENGQALAQSLVEHPEQVAPLQMFIEHPEIVCLSNLADLSGDGTALLPRTGSMLLAPVFYEQRLAAALILQSRREAAFSPVVCEFMESLALQTAVAIGNAHRYAEQLERGQLMYQRAEQMRLLLEVARTMRSDRPLDDTLLDMAYATQEAIGYEIVLISVLEGSMVRRAAGAGMPLTELERMKEVRRPWDNVKKLLQERFQIGHCYYIPSEFQEIWRGGIDVFEPEAETNLERIPGTWHPHDILLIPLYSTQEEILGYMSVDRPHDGRAPQRGSLEVLELFAAQVAVVIENNRLVENLRFQLNTLMLFNELSRSVTTKLDLSLVLNTVVQSVTNLLGYDYATVFLQDRDGLYLRPKASSGYDLDLLQDMVILPGEGLAGTVAQTGMPLTVEDVSRDPRFLPGPITIGASIMVPLRVEDRTVGILNADKKTAADFSPAQVATLTMLADQVSVAVENAQLFEEVKRFSSELEQRVEERTAELAEALDDLRAERDRSTVLFRIASELVASLDIDRVLHKTVTMLCDAVDASRGTILLLDRNTGHLYQRASIGGPPLPPGGVRAHYTRGEGLIGWVLENKQSARVTDVSQDARWIPLEDGTRSVLAVPIMSGGIECVGGLFLHSLDVNAFNESDQRLVEAAAVQLGNALNNAELYQLIREQTERLGAMLRKQQNEAARNQAILEGIADGVMVADAESRIILFNIAAERILSVSRSVAQGRYLDEMLGLYGVRAKDWMDQIRIWQDHPDAYQSGEYLAERLDLERRVVSVHLSPVIAPTREFLGVVSVFRDVTAEVEADRAKSEFVATVSHELRTPMTSVKGYVDLLLMGATGSLNEMQTRFLNVIRSNADRLTSLLNDLLDMSRIETGKIVLDIKPVDMASLIDQVFLTLKPKAEDKGVILRAFVPPHLPKAFGDPDRIVQVLTNLVSNGYKYTPVGGEVSLHAYVRDAMFHIAVVDTGIGISAEDQERIFSRFYRVDDPLVQEVAGTGLGLAITASLVQMQGGEIWVESEPGEGSIFSVTFPLAEGEPVDSVGRAPLGFGAAAPATILVVEDDPEIAQLLNVRLQNEGKQVLLAASGMEALHIAREQHPDLISLDIRLPDLDGFEVLQLLKREPQTEDIPVVVVSVVMDKDRGLRLGAVDYLTKPLDQERLVSVVDHILAKRDLVLVVDDDQDTLSLLREALRSQELSVRTTTRGDRAIKLARELQPALILLDLKLPGVDGYQVLEQLKQSARTAHIPVIVITGTVTPEEGVPPKIEELGAFRFLTKPFEI
ncbi:MAG: GAF domain-containing protein, partial [Anaerolineae bacterium]|nr:GAF domain-containing protein [Anaerolineae bacterium]